MKCLLVPILILLFAVPAGASKLYWSVKREIAKQTIWKYYLSNNVRASSQLIKEAGVLSLLSHKEKLVRDLEVKKRIGLAWLGVNNWKASNTRWDRDTLIVKGEYEDREKNKFFFEERHCFEKDRRIILLLSSTEKESLSDEKIISFFKVAKNWEQKK